jgi:alkylation response protein AidB-like acyl-CoA dehydrogenase
LGLFPVIWWGSEEQKKKWFSKALNDPDKDFIVSWVVSEPEGTANFDHPDEHPVGLQCTADYDAKTNEYVLNGKKMWNSNATGWEKKGADMNIVVARTDRTKGGKEGLSAFIVPPGLPGYHVDEVLQKMGHRTSVAPRLTFDNVRIPAENLIEKSEGNGDLAISKAFMWSGAVAGAAAVGVMRAAFEEVLDWSKNFTAGSATPIIHYQNAGYMLGNMKMRLEAIRYLSWKAAHLLDIHDYEAIEACVYAKVFGGETAVEVVSDAMRLMGINAYLNDYPLERHMRDALCFPIYDAGNMGMQRRKLHGLMSHPSYNSQAMAENVPLEFAKHEMHGIDVVPGHDVKK